MNIRQTLITGTVGAFSLVTATSVAFAAMDKEPTSATLNPVTCSAALDAVNTSTASALDQRTVAEKSALATKTTALKAAIVLTDFTAQKSAVKAAEKAFHTSMQTAMKNFMESTKTSVQNLHTACPGLGGRMGNRGMMMGKNKEMMKSHREEKDFMGTMMKNMKQKMRGETQEENE